MIEISKEEFWVGVFFILLVIGVLGGLTLYIYTNLDLETFCKFKNGIYEGDYVVRNDCLIKNEDNYIRYTIERDNKNKPILVRE